MEFFQGRKETDMYLVKLPEGQGVRWLFTYDDPRLEGCPFEVEENVQFDDGAEEINVIRQGPSATATAFGRANDDPSHYRQFRSLDDLREAGYERLLGAPQSSASWRAFHSLNCSIGGGRGQGRTSHG
jgi:hypothetical protein